MLKRTKSKEQILTLLSDPEPLPPLDRGAKEKEAVRWLHSLAKEMKVSHNDPAYEFMAEKLRENRTELEAAWKNGDDEEFRGAVKRWAAIGRKALRAGVEAEEEVLEQKGEIQSAGQVFRAVEKKK